MFGGEMQVKSVFGEGSEFSFIINIQTNRKKEVYFQRKKVEYDIESNLSNLKFKWRPNKHKTDNITLRYIAELNISENKQENNSEQIQSLSEIMDEASIRFSQS